MARKRQITSGIHYNNNTVANKFMKICKRAPDDLFKEETAESNLNFSIIARALPYRKLLFM